MPDDPLAEPAELPGARRLDTDVGTAEDDAAAVAAVVSRLMGLNSAGGTEEEEEEDEDEEEAEVVEGWKEEIGAVTEVPCDAGVGITGSWNWNVCGENIH